MTAPAALAPAAPRGPLASTTPDLGSPLPLGFVLDAVHEAHEPPEARGRVPPGASSPHRAMPTTWTA